MATIFEIEKNVQEALLLIDESEGEITPEIEELLNINENDLKNKINQYNFVTNETLYKIEGINFEIQRLEQRKETELKRIKGIQQFVKKALNLYGVKNAKSKAKHKPIVVDTGLVKAVLSYSEVVEIENQNSITVENVPAELQKYTTLDIDFKIPYSNWNKEFETKLKAVNESVKVSIANISKTAIKEDLEKGVELEEAKFIKKEKIEFK